MEERLQRLEDHQAIFANRLDAIETGMKDGFAKIQTDIISQITALLGTKQDERGKASMEGGDEAEGQVETATRG